LAGETPSTKGFDASVAAAAAVIVTAAATGSYIRVVSHIDADGIAAASILGRALNRAEAYFHIRTVKQLDRPLVEELASETRSSPVIFADLGSGYLELLTAHMAGLQLVVLDHHQPEDVTAPGLVHVNPHGHGFDGSKEISAAGVAYLTAKAMDATNVESAALAVVGALGDSQDAGQRRSLTGLNARIVRDAVECGQLHVDTDLIFFGRETRPIHKALAYTTNPFIPGLSGEEDQCLGFLVNLGIELKDGDEWRSLSALSDEEKQKIFTAIAKHLASRGVPNDRTLGLIGTTYTLPAEDRRTPMRDAREYASLLNACGRMRRNGLGVSIGMGCRGQAVTETLDVVTAYKKALAQCLSWVLDTPGVVEKQRNIYVVDGSDVIDELLLSTVTSILNASHYFREERPVLGFAEAEGGMVKASCRVLNDLNGDLNLGVILDETAAKFDGLGGGHNVAAGARIPEQHKRDFTRAVDAMVGHALRRA
jgi:RecJ-like exonuclease